MLVVVGEQSEGFAGIAGRVMFEQIQPAQIATVFVDHGFERIGAYGNRFGGRQIAPSNGGGSLLFRLHSGLLRLLRLGVEIIPNHQGQDGDNGENRRPLQFVVGFHNRVPFENRRKRQSAFQCRLPENSAAMLHRCSRQT